MGLPHNGNENSHTVGERWCEGKEPIHRQLRVNEQNFKDRQACLTFKNCVKVSDDIYVTVNRKKAQGTLLKQNKKIKTG